MVEPVALHLLGLISTIPCEGTPCPAPLMFPVRRTDSPCRGCRGWKGAGLVQEWDSIKMVGCPKCGGLMVEGGTCRACGGSGAAQSIGAADYGPAAGNTWAPAAYHAAAPVTAGMHRSTGRGPSVPLILGGAGLLGLVALVAVYAFFWSGAGGAMPSPREQLYVADLAKVQVAVQQAGLEFMVVQSAPSDVMSGSAVPAMQAAYAVEQAAAAWKGRESPSGGFAQEHARLVASLQQMATAAVDVREGLQGGDPARASDGAARFLARQSEFTVAATTLFERTAAAGR